MNDDNHDESRKIAEDIKFIRTAIDWRRHIVLCKLAKGWSQSDIAKELKLHPSTISLDVQYLKTKAQEQLRSHIQEVIPFEFQKSRQAISDLIRRANEILDNNDDDPKMQLQVINTLANLHAANMNLNSEGNIIELAYKKVQTLEEIQRRSSEEAVFSDDDVREYYQNEREEQQATEPKPKPEPEPANTKITTIGPKDYTL